MAEKKKFKDTKFGQFVNKAKDSLPELANVAMSVVSGNYVGAIGQVGKMLKDKHNESEDLKALHIEFESLKMDFEKEMYELEFKDRQSARELYKDDSLIQKILASVFTIAYFIISGILINHFFNDTIKLDDYELGFISTLFGAMSSKVNTIIDFFFGGSSSKK